MDCHSTSETGKSVVVCGAQFIRQNHIAIVIKLIAGSSIVLSHLSRLARFRFPSRLLK
jgi:hypothetical protein